MANRKVIGDEAVQAEIEKLKASPYVKLARKELRLKYKERQVLYSLRNLEKRGKVLDSQGITIENIDSMILKTELESGKEE